MKMLSAVNLMVAALLIDSNYAYSWNALGHQVIAQIAYSELSRDAKIQCRQVNHGLDKLFKPRSLINAASWLDSLRYQNDLWLKRIHYINIPFTLDNSKLVPADHINAVTAIDKAITVLQNNKASNYDKGFSLRILLHVIGDIHQPLHTGSQVSRQYPRGDKGGNLFSLAKNDIANNLHGYWDRGGGLLIQRKKITAAAIKQMANEIKTQYPCYTIANKQQPILWAYESHLITVHQAYQIKAGEKPSQHYQNMVKTISKQQLAKAGCRLAMVINQLYQK